MALSFCSKCKNILPPQHSDENFVVCPKCGLLQKIKGDLISTENTPKKIQKGHGIGSDENVCATYDHTCKRCGYSKAQVIDMGVKYSDEDNLIFLKCGKCSFSERIGRKTS
jgi:DNA-directed RNA polymerase subunit M/transcription elongation factor TFIIS